LITYMKCEDCTQTDLRKATANNFASGQYELGLEIIINLWLWQQDNSANEIK